ncbi:MAG: hypothetical protein AB1679_01450 [Actinomycetota bacterium]
MTSLVGEFFLNLIEQDRIWKTREGRVLLVEELEPRHRANVLTMLGRRAPGLYREWIREFLDEGVTYAQLVDAGVVTGDPGGSRPIDIEGWFESQPLIRRLRQLEADSTGAVVDR